MTRAFRLHRGDDLLESLRAWCAAERIEAAAIVSGVGCVDRAVVRDASGVTVHTLTGRYEIVSMTGTLSAARCHIHIALAGEDLRVIGGHLRPGTRVNTTCEVVALVLDGVRFGGAYDPETGYDELTIAASDRT